jgi:hypothetical protein
MAQINFGLLNTDLPAQIGAMPGNALAARRQRIAQDEDRSFAREGAQMQNALARMQMTKAQEDMGRETAFRNAFAGVTDGNYEGALPQMYQADPARAMAFQKTLSEQKKAGIDAEKGQFELVKQRFDVMDRAAGRFAANPTRQTAVSVLSELSAMGAPPDVIKQMSERLNAAPDEQLPEMARQFLAATQEGIQAQTAKLFPKPAAASDLSRLMAERDALPPGDPRRAMYDQALSKQTTHAPGTRVEVNTGQKGFENELKLRGDFRGEPVYKAHQEMNAAYNQIRQALGQKSPAGDLAGATKIMKLLDPGSVVRESELGMAMAASGLLDRVSSYATNVLNGTKLTPTQRKDFQALADALYSESVKAYNAKGDEYRGVARDYGMSDQRTVGAPAVFTPPPASPYVETRRTADGRLIGKLPDGTLEVIQQ